jgi:CBS domain-containing protein
MVAGPRILFRAAQTQEKCMPNYDIPVELYMTQPVHSVTPDDDLNAVQSRLSELKVSSLPVVERGNGSDSLVGLISMTDLIRIGRRQAGSRSEAALLTLPDLKVEKRMSREVVTVAPGDFVSVAASKMVQGHIHRVYVVDGGRLVGVLSSRDVMLAIRDKQTKGPISKWMTSPAFTVRAEEPVSLATDRLGKARVSGLIVVENDWPIGLFTQREALESKDLARDTLVEQTMSSAMLILAAHTPLHRAAAQAAALRVRRVIVVESDRVVGILTGLDFAKAGM